MQSSTSLHSTTYSASAALVYSYIYIYVCVWYHTVSRRFYVKRICSFVLQKQIRTFIHIKFSFLIVSVTVYYFVHRWMIWNKDFYECKSRDKLSSKRVKWTGECVNVPLFLSFSLFLFLFFFLLYTTVRSSPIEKIHRNKKTVVEKAQNREKQLWEIK